MTFILPFSHLLFCFICADLEIKLTLFVMPIKHIKLKKYHSFFINTDFKTTYKNIIFCIRKFSPFQDFMHCQIILIFLNYCQFSVPKHSLSHVIAVMQVSNDVISVQVYMIFHCYQQQDLYFHRSK